MSALTDIAAERQRQIEQEGFTPKGDDRYSRGELAQAAIAYAMVDWHDSQRMAEFPWSENWWKPRDRRRDLVKAAALIVAEIERIDRMVS